MKQVISNKGNYLNVKWIEYKLLILKWHTKTYRYNEFMNRGHKSQNI